MVSGGCGALGICFRDGDKTWYCMSFEIGFLQGKRRHAGRRDLVVFMRTILYSYLFCRFVLNPRLYTMESGKAGLHFDACTYVSSSRARRLGGIYPTNECKQRSSRFPVLSLYGLHIDIAMTSSTSNHKKALQISDG